MKLQNIFICGAVVLAAAAGCAKENTTSSNEQLKQYLDAWVSQNYPDATVTDAGAYILGDTPGTGDTYDGEDYVMVNYTITSIDGTISSTTREKVSQQLGTYDKTYYYGQKVWYAANDNLPAGIEEALEGMKIGETKKVLLPSWLMGDERYDDPKEYFKHTVSSGSTSIYEFTLEEFTDDINQWEINQIEAYTAKKYGASLDSLSYGFYYIENKAPIDTTSFDSDTTIYVNYIGRLLNGLVFDTTIKDTAKKYNLYSESKDYEPVEITWGEEYTDIEMDSSTPITGFQKLLWQMRDKGASTGIFISNLGYASSGSGNSIPGYAPLIFDIEIVDDPDD